MAYHSRHSIFLHDNDKQKLSLVQSILNEEGLSFVAHPLNASMTIFERI